MKPIEIFFESVEELTLPEEALKSWLKQAVLDHHKELESLNIILCTDDFLHDLNVQYLDHDTLTDIITFDYNHDDQVNGELYISLDRVEENARENHVSTIEELHRVMIHGVLHLVGYKDKSPEDQTEMRGREDYYLSLRTF